MSKNVWNAIVLLSLIVASVLLLGHSEVALAPGSAGSVTGDLFLVSNAARTKDHAESRSLIPSTLFGMDLMYQGDWPTVPFGALGKGTLTKWVYIEQVKGAYNWANLDAWVAQANSKGVPFTWTHEMAPPWAVADQSTCAIAGDGVSRQCSGAVADLAGFHDFIVALVSRYDGNHGHGRISCYELYNEPETFFTGTVSNLVAQTVQMYNDIRATDPTARVVGIGMTYPDTHFAPGGYMDQYWAAGGVTGMDAVTFHGYPHHFNDVPESISEFANAVKALMAKYGLTDKPIWDTEGSWGLQTDPGWNVTDPDQQAAFVARHYLLHWSNGVARFDWYAWGNTTWGPLWDSSNGIHTAGVAYGQVENWMVGSTMSTPCSANGTVWTCGFTRPDGHQALAVWDTSGASTYTPASQYQWYRDLAGNTTGIAGGSVPIGIKPILLE